MSCDSLQRKNSRFQEETFDLEMQLFELGFLCENNVPTEKFDMFNIIGT